jgi:hypothetical protein
MPYQGFEDGLYHVVQRSEAKGVEHHGILDIGNRIRPRAVRGGSPTVIHQTPPRVRIDPLANTGNWRVLRKIEDERGAVDRIRVAVQAPAYSLTANNCEHFASFVDTGTPESIQVQRAVLLGFIATLAYLSVRSKAH